MVPIDKSSTILTILLAFLFFQEPLSWIKWICVAAIAAGTFLMIEKKESDGAPQTKSWLIYALLSALFASLSGILGKIGIDGVESNLGTAIRTAVVLVMAWIVVFAGGKAREIRKTPRKELLFICLSGIATGASWLCYYKALQTGVASTVIAVDKLSILFTVLFSRIVFKEKLCARSLAGLILIVAGTLCMLL